MKKIKIYYAIVTLLAVNFIYSQSEIAISQESVSTQLENYFKLEREKIHLHLNKSSYLTTDAIWFKGYIIEKKINAPFFTTSNVYITILDEKGNKITTKLFFAENSVFEGTIKLDDSYKTGKYYLQVFTNFMNNFTEDESSVFEIYIINSNDEKIANLKKINYNAISVSFFPESGTFLQNIQNSIGVKISDCNSNGISINNIEIVDSKGNNIAVFSTDKLGYGRVSIIPQPNETYKAIFTINDTKYEEKLPASVKEGIVLSMNNYSSKDKTIINIKSNSNSLNLLKANINSLLIQQNETASLIPITFKENEFDQTFSIANDKLLNGINIFSIIDSKGKIIAERIVYNALKSPKISELSIQNTSKDSIVISGKSSLIKGNISISILPSDSDELSTPKSILDSFLFDNYLKDASKNTNHYLYETSRVKQFELDNFLLTQKSKYEVKDYLSKAPEKKYDFDNGLTVKGTVNNEITSNIENYKVNINSISLGLNESTAINTKKEFAFENVLAIDSTSLYFTLYDKKSKPTALNVYCQILNNTRKFNKSFIVNTKLCEVDKDLQLDDFILPKISGQIILDQVAIEAKKKEVLTNKSRFSNSASRGYKIDDQVAGTFRDVLSFIRSHGYNVTESGGDVIISRTYTTTITGNNTPAIFLDDVPVDPLSLLRNMLLSTIDEIYINKTGYGGGLNASNGVIRIYSKMPNASDLSAIKIKSKPFIVTKGFEKYVPFENPKYSNTNDSGFQNFGTIHWAPSVDTDEFGNFKFSIPNLNQKSIKIIIEGISSEGDLLSEIKTITVN